VCEPRYIGILTTHRRLRDGVRPCSMHPIGGASRGHLCNSWRPGARQPLWTKSKGKVKSAHLLSVLAAPSLGTRNTPVSGASSVPGRAAPGLQLGLAVHTDANSCKFCLVKTRHAHMIGIRQMHADIKPKPISAATVANMTYTCFKKKANRGEQQGSRNHPHAELTSP
jgi:hypothetical protein